MSETENELEQTNQDIDSSKPLKLRNQSNFDVDVVIGNLVVCAMDVNHNYNNINGANLESSSIDVDVDRVTINNVVNGDGTQHANCSVTKPLIDIITAHIEKENGCGYTHPNASEEVSGYVKWDKDTLDFLREQLGVIDVKPSEPIDVPTATEYTLGVVKPDNDTIKINEDGTIYATFENVEIDKATEETFGIVKPDGETITIQDGVISAVIPEVEVDLPLAEADVPGIVRPDNMTIIIDETGTISAQVPVYDPATTDDYGLVRWDEATVNFLKNQIGKLDVTDTINVATTDTLGVVRVDGTTITITPEGVLSANIPNIEIPEIPDIPVASETESGLVKWDEDTFELISNNITFPEFPDVEIPEASETQAGIVKWDTTTIDFIKNKIGQLDVTDTIAIATNDTTGVVKPDGRTITIDDRGTLTVQFPETEIPEVPDVTVYKGDEVTIFTDTEKNELYTYELDVEGEADSFITLKVDETNKVYRIINNEELYDRITTTVEWSAGVDDRLDELEKIGIATAAEVGLVKPDGTTIEVRDDGTLQVIGVVGGIGGGGDQTVEIATATRAGIVKPDNTSITVAADGTLSVVFPEVEEKEDVQIDDVTITKNADGKLQANYPTKLVQLEDVDTGDLNDSEGMCLVVNEDGSGFELKHIGSGINRSQEFEINSDDYVLVYDFAQEVNRAAHASIQCWTEEELDVFSLEFRTSSGISEYDMKTSLNLYLPDREFRTQLFAKGKGKGVIDILRLY